MRDYLYDTRRLGIPMKCPICGQELRPGKKDPNYLLCYNCKKKFKAPAEKTVKVKKEEEEPRYSNIPPKKVREKREAEMKKAYDEMLAEPKSMRAAKRTAKSLFAFFIFCTSIKFNAFAPKPLQIRLLYKGI